MAEKRTDMAPDFSLTLAELRKTWTPWHWSGTILLDRITLIEEDAASLVRTFEVKTIDIPIIEDP